MDLIEFDFQHLNNDILNELALNFSSHYPNGGTYSTCQKSKGIDHFNANEIPEAVYYFSESHFPSLRTRATYRYQRSVKIGSVAKSLHNENIDFTCCKVLQSLDNIMDQIEEMPKEWTVVQLTAYDWRYNKFPFRETKNIIPTLYVSVFHCGERSNPICVKIDPPDDFDIGVEFRKAIELACSAETNSARFEACAEMKSAVNRIETRWLRHFKYLLLGKLIDTSELNVSWNRLLKSSYSEYERLQLTKVAYSNLSRREIILAVANIVDNSELAEQIYDFSRKHKELIGGKRHPVILIVDQFLDYLPWESIPFLKMHPFSRIPSIRFLYQLFKEHKVNIKNGLVTKSTKGGYVVYADEDLKKMEDRLQLFYKYYFPHWPGLISNQITSDQFSKLLTESDIFVYSGHGAGTQLLKGSTIQTMRVNGVVFLFGCESVTLQSDGGFEELWSTFFHYLIACSPCVVGNNYKVASGLTDIVTGKLLSMLVPSKTKQWTDIDDRQWLKETKLVLRKNKVDVVVETEVLRAVALARQSGGIFLNEAALIVRGLPVVIK